MVATYGCSTNSPARQICLYSFPIFKKPIRIQISLCSPTGISPGRFLRKSNKLLETHRFHYWHCLITRIVFRRDGCLVDRHEPLLPWSKSETTPRVKLLTTKMKPPLTVRYLDIIDPLDAQASFQTDFFCRRRYFYMVKQKLRMVFNPGAACMYLKGYNCVKSDFFAN